MRKNKFRLWLSKIILDMLYTTGALRIEVIDYEVDFAKIEVYFLGSLIKQIELEI